ncbi:hypothetical protein DBR37_06575 [Herminiimonas sp. KBW02]|uniref:hypothetical protein n=1 Tax=Herminiimonas sp. KBW02 TaxID=2153363 RepID=UPI000F595F39|nr:hypothetical protein [Herminiimonas sp. KBW02]RQO36004.1 hypothetical protein DBR37_06575 [Herminiimonas sp. KBW02]
MARPRFPRQDNNDQDKAPPLSWHLLWQLPVGFITLFALIAPGLLLAMLPLIAGWILTASFDNPSDYEPYSSWLWRGLYVLCMTHISYGMYLLLKLLATKVSSFIPIEGVILLALISGLLGAIVIESQLLNFANVHTGTQRFVDGKLLRHDVLCTTTYSRHTRVASTTCSGVTLFATTEGGLYIRGLEYDRVIQKLRPQAAVRLTLCESVLGTTVLQIESQAVWRSPLDLAKKTGQACTPRTDSKTRHPGSIMDSVASTTHAMFIT